MAPNTPSIRPTLSLWVSVSSALGRGGQLFTVCSSSATTAQAGQLQAGSWDLTLLVLSKSLPECALAPGPQGLWTPQWAAVLRPGPGREPAPLPSHSWLWSGAGEKGLYAFGRTPDHVFLQNTKLQDEASAASCVHTASVLGVQRAQTLLTHSRPSSMLPKASEPWPSPARASGSVTVLPFIGREQESHPAQGRAVLPKGPQVGPV